MTLHFGNGIRHEITMLPGYGIPSLDPGCRTEKIQFSWSNPHKILIVTSTLADMLYRPNFD